MVQTKDTTFGELLKGYRVRTGLTQEELAERANLSARGISDLERGLKQRPHAYTVQRLVQALELVGSERDAFQGAARHGGEPNSSGRAPATTRTNLPDEPTPFIGREREVEAVVNLLQRPAVRLVTLTGPGGSGKTRLAVQVAAELLDRFEDGDYFVSLASLSDPDLVATAIAAVVGVQERGGTSLIDALEAYLQPRRVLLILDNVEHLLDAVPQIGELLDRCPNLHVLVTSRIPLHLAREHEYAVPPLSVPDPHHLPPLDQVRRYDAVALFLERAQAARSDFAMTDQNAPAVVEICRRLDGLPLAIVLAAARVKLFPPGALLQRLADRFTLLTAGAADRPVRHHTLRAAIDWSYSLLTEPDRELFARLSVFTGGCTLEAAEAVCCPAGEPEIDVLGGVMSLAEQSLLRQEGEEEPRFGMLETIREYAGERLAHRGTEEMLRQRHATYFLSVAEGLSPQLTGPNRAQGLNRLAAEHDNLRAALSWAQERAEVELGLRLAVALSVFWETRGHLTEGNRWLTDLLSAAETTSPGLRAAALAAAGTLANSLGNIDESVGLLRQSLDLYRQVGDARGSAEAMHRFAHLSFMWRHGLWCTALEEHLAWGRELGDRVLVATCLHWLGWMAAFQQDAGRARTFADESLALFRDLGDTVGTVNALLVLTHAAYGEGDVRSARALCAEITALLPGLSLDTGTRERMQGVAYKARDCGDYEHAGRLLDGALARALEAGDRRNAAYIQGCLALFAREQGEYDRATVLYRQSLAVFQEVGDRWGSCTALLGLGDVARDRGEAEDVNTPCRQVLELGREIGSPMIVGFALQNLALAARAQAEYEEAEALLGESLAILLVPEHGAEVISNVGLLALDQGQYDRANDAFTESLRTALTTNERWMIPTLLEGLAGVAVGRGEPSRAARLFGIADVFRTAFGVPIPPMNRPRYEHDVAAARAALGEERFTSLWEEGRAMTVERAIASARDELPSADDADDTRSRSGERQDLGDTVPAGLRLSRRERQARALEHLQAAGSLSPRAYASLVGVSVDTALRDLRELVDQRVVEAKGTTRDRRYGLTGEAVGPTLHPTAR